MEGMNDDRALQGKEDIYSASLHEFRWRLLFYLLLALSHDNLLSRMYSHVLLFWLFAVLLAIELVLLLHVSPKRYESRSRSPTTRSAWNLYAPEILCSSTWVRKP